VPRRRVIARERIPTDGAGKNRVADNFG